MNKPQRTIGTEQNCHPFEAGLRSRWSGAPARVLRSKVPGASAVAPSRQARVHQAPESPERVNRNGPRI
jgi:hypothetical protein